MKRYIPVSRSRYRLEAGALRPAEGTYEREMSKEGFFRPGGVLPPPPPAHRWTEFTGPLQPRAFDSPGWRRVRRPWSAHEGDAHCRIPLLRLPGRMPRLARNADGDELLFVHAGVGELYCDSGLSMRATTSALPARHDVAHRECAATCSMIEPPTRATSCRTGTGGTHTRSSTPRCSTRRGSTPSSWRSSPTTRHGRSR